MGNSSSIVNKENILTGDKQRKHRDTIAKIISELRTALILHNMKTGNKGNFLVGNMRFSDQWKISYNKKDNHTISKDIIRKGPVDISRKIDDINIFKIKEELFTIIDANAAIDPEDKKQYKSSINNFIQNQFAHTRNKLEHKNKKHTIHRKFRQYYKKLVKELDIPLAKKNLYKDICLTLANVLYDKDRTYLDHETGAINENGLAYISRIFFTTIENFGKTDQKKPFNKIFHDGDFNFLRKTDFKGDPLVGTLDHYVQTIMYLMDDEPFNAYAEDGGKGTEEWIRTKNAFLNSLFTSTTLEDEPKYQEPSDKEIVHNHLAKQRKSIIAPGGNTQHKNRELCDRFKGDTSIFLKKGGKQDVEVITDESGLRATYYEDNENNQDIGKNIASMIENYLNKIQKIPGIKIEAIEYSKQKDFINEQQLNEIVASIKNNIGSSIKVLPRKKQGGVKNKLESISSKYKHLTGDNPSPGLQESYQMAQGLVLRGSNGHYKDFKFIIKYNIDAKKINTPKENITPPIEKDLTIFQEISFYPRDNDLNFGNHHFLDLEKKIFNSVKNTKNNKFPKSISLHKLRYLTETALKDISFDIDKYEDKVKKGILVPPQNDHYQYLQIGDKKISLKNLSYRNAENTERFDELITEVLNYFIQKNKLIYVNKEKDSYHGMIKTDDLKHHSATYRKKRFCTPDVLKNEAEEYENKDYYICFFTPNEKSRFRKNFYQIKLEELGSFIGLENISLKTKL